jgi:hypothetical protein
MTNRGGSNARNAHVSYSTPVCILISHAIKKEKMSIKSITGVDCIPLWTRFQEANSKPKNENEGPKPCPESLTKRARSESLVSSLSHCLNQVLFHKQ